MRRFCFVALIALISAVGAKQSGAISFEAVISEADVQALTGQADVDFSEVTVASDGTIYFVDVDPILNETLYQATISGGIPTITTVTTEMQIIAAVNLATSPTMTTSFNIGRLAMDSSDNVIAQSGDGAAADTLVRITPAGAITVLESDTGSGSALEGAVAMTVLNDVAYIVREQGFGGADDIVSLPVTGSGPNTAVSTLVTSPAMQALDGTNFIALSDIYASPLSQTLVFTNSGAAGTSDNIYEVTTGGLTSTIITSPTLLAQISPDTEVGWVSLAVDGDDTVWLLNGFGVNNVGFDDGVIRVSSTGTVSGFTETTIGSFVGSASLGLVSRSLAYDATNSRLLFSSSTGFEGIISIQKELPFDPFGSAITATRESWMMYH